MKLAQGSAADFCNMPIGFLGRLVRRNLRMGQIIFVDDQIWPKGHNLLTRALAKVRKKW